MILAKLSYEQSYNISIIHIMLILAGLREHIFYIFKITSEGRIIQFL